MATKRLKPKEWIGYVMKHVPTDNWAPMHSMLKVYYAEHEAWSDYPRFDPPGWVPVRVVVREDR